MFIFSQCRFCHCYITHSSYGIFADEYSAEKKNPLGHYSQYRDFVSKGKDQAEKFLFIKNDETVVLSSIATR